MKSDKTSRMAALLDRLQIAQHAVTGPPPTRVSFSKLAEWCVRTAGIPEPEVYRDLLQSYLSGAFENTLVFYLTDSAPDLSEKDLPDPSEPDLIWHQMRREDFLTGYRMRRDFLAARARNYPTDHDNEAAALFSTYLGPCWIHRKAAVRWLEGRGYSVPTWWKQAKQPEDLPTVPPKEKQNKRGRKFEYDWEDVEQYVWQELDERGHYGDPGQVDDWKCQNDLVKIVIEYMEKHPPYRVPAQSTLKKRIKPMVDAWVVQEAADN